MIITIVRKPLINTVLETLKESKCGGLNIDISRISTSDKLSIGSNNRSKASVNFGMKDNKESQKQNAGGRFPTNLLLTELTAKVLGKQSGVRTTGGGDKRPKGSSLFFGSDHTRDKSSKVAEKNTGTAERFFKKVKE